MVNLSISVTKHRVM